eukprot:gene8035-10890_t
MRRKVGVSAVKKGQDDANRYKSLAKTLEDTKLAHVKETLTAFQTSLAEFAAKHKDKINSDAEFRQQFHTMCISVGVDPLASSKGFWADLLGVGDFYFELGYKIIQICVKTRATNGGILTVNELVNLLRKSSKSNQKISYEDVRRAAEKLVVLGGGFKIVYIGGNAMVLSVPIEINTDHELLLSAAQDEDGYITSQLMISLHGWTLERFNIVMNPLLYEGIVWIDYHEGAANYYFPSMWQPEKEA